MDSLQNFLQPLQENAQAVRVDNLVVPGFVDPLQARLYRPLGVKAKLPALLYFHGGGFVGGSLDDADCVARFIAEHAPAAVLSVAYSLAPQRPFPAAPEDAHAAAMWLHSHCKDFGVDGKRIAVAGDDAGGNLAAALCLMARDRCGPKFLAQVLIAPMLDPSMTKLGDAKQLNSDVQPETCASRYAQYLPRSQERLHPYAAPLESCRLRNLPPALIATAECDVLHKEAEQYASSLIAAGVSTQVARFPGQHAELPHQPNLLNEVVSFLKRHFYPQRARLDTAIV